MSKKVTYRIDSHPWELYQQWDNVQAVMQEPLGVHVLACNAKAAESWRFVGCFTRKPRPIWAVNT